jgi:uncharacterized protein (TIGR02145 family)
MKKAFLLFAMACFAFAGVLAQNGEIANLQVSQRTDGSGLVDIHFDLNGTGAYYNLQFEASFDDGANYATIAAEFLTGQLELAVPGEGKHIIWDGKATHPETFSTQTKVRVIAIEQITPFVCGDNFIDARDGNVYTTVQIGEKCWMAENLNIGARIDGSTNQTDNGIIEKYCYDNLEVNCYLHGGLYHWDEMMGYTTIVGVQGICPLGWHVPSDAEWTQLSNYISSQGFPNSNVINGAGNALKSCRQVNTPLGGNCNTNEYPRWNSHDTHYGFDEFGFTALPGGHYSNGSFKNLGVSGSWWSSNEINSTGALYRFISYAQGHLILTNYSKTSNYSVRCLKDSPNQPPSPPSNPSPESGSTNQPINLTLTWTCSDPDIDPITYDVYFGVEDNPPPIATGISESSYMPFTLQNSTTYYWKVTAQDNQGNITEGEVWNFTTTQEPFVCGNSLVPDVDGNLYITVQIGSQCWMKENLKTTKYRNGTDISYPGNDNTNWQTNTTGAYAWYNNDIFNKNTYGALYNWHAAVNDNKLCPTGWHVPTEDDWITLMTHLSSQLNYICNSNTTYIAKALAATTNWNSSTNTCAVGNNLSANNATEFSGLPGGTRNASGIFNKMLNEGGFWVSTEYSTSYTWFRVLDYSGANVVRYVADKNSGFSVRCLKD